VRVSSPWGQKEFPLDLPPESERVPFHLPDMAGAVKKTLLVSLGWSVVADEALPGKFLERNLQAYSFNDLDDDGWGDPYYNTGNAYNSSSPSHYIWLHEGYCYGVAEEQPMNAYLDGGAYEGKWETNWDIRIDMYSRKDDPGRMDYDNITYDNTSEIQLGWKGGRCFMEAHGEFWLPDDQNHSVWYASRASGIPHQIWCDAGPDPANQTGYFHISYANGNLVRADQLVNDTDFHWPANVDAYSSNEDWCARRCALTDDCRYFSFDYYTSACRFHEEKGGCHPQPTSHRRRYGISNTYLIPKEFSTELSVDHIADALEAGRDYTFSHNGFCASGWLSGMVNHRSTLEACARWCRDVPVCGHFTFSAGQELCSLYDVEDECGDSGPTADFQSFQIVRPDEDDDHYDDYQLKHMGFCSQDSLFLGYDTDRQFPYVYQCAEYCYDTMGCGYFSFSRRNFHCRLFGTCGRPDSPYGDWPNDQYHGEPTQYGLENNLQYGEHNMENNFTWHWEANEWYPWSLPNTTDYMYSSYQVGSGYRRDPGVSSPYTFGEFLGCGDAPTFIMESTSEHVLAGQSIHCREFFPGWSCESSDSDVSNYSEGNCSASCGLCQSCYDIDVGGQANTHGYGCELYNEMPLLCDIAESYDNDDFTASFHCCVCGGGSRNVCLPNDFVVIGGQNAFVVALDTDADTLIVEFPYLTGAATTAHPYADATKNGRPCTAQHSTEGHAYQNYMYNLAWGR